MAFDANSFLKAHKKEDEFNVDSFLAANQPDSLMSFLPEPVSSLALPETRQEQLPILPADKTKYPGFKEAKFTEDPLAWLARGVLGMGEFATMPMRTEMRQENLEQEGTEDPLAAYKEVASGLKEEYTPSAKAAAKIIAGGSLTDPLTILGSQELGKETVKRLNRSMQPLFDIAILGGIGSKAISKIAPKAKIKLKPKPATEPAPPVETEFLESIVKPNVLHGNRRSLNEKLLNQQSRKS